MLHRNVTYSVFPFHKMYNKGCLLQLQNLDLVVTKVAVRLHN